MIAAGSVIGVVGGGQLARMIGTAAACLGYRMHVYCPDADSPAFHVAGTSIQLLASAWTAAMSSFVHVCLLALSFNR
jgi:phosphoribosylaminoimidazole carboxylase (NCAIR synthetase)